MATVYSRTRYQKTFVLVAAMLWFLGLGNPTGLMAQPAKRGPSSQCFSETRQCLDSAFTAYWSGNGGLEVFGFPVTPGEIQQNPDSRTFHQTQWFERNRLEAHPETPPPFDILLGRLGDDRLRQLNINWKEAPRERGPKPGCRWFEETRINVCNQGGNLGFRTFWESRGLKDSRLSREQRSLLLFGLPLTVAQEETNPNGDTVITQWFERARFEWHPEKPDEYKVLLGLLGNEVRGPVQEPGCSKLPNSGCRAPQDPTCPTPLTGGFGTIWQQNAKVRDRLGCPLQQPVIAQAVEQVFERGLMYWWEPAQEIYVLIGDKNGTWSRYQDTYREGEELSPLPQTPPPGLTAPIRGFGKLWREKPQLAQALGWARGPELSQPDRGGVHQPFRRGAMLYSNRINGHDEQVYVLFEDGTYETFPEP